MQTVEQLLALFNAHLQSNQPGKEPDTLYEPLRYFLALGGKRIRPILVLMSTELFGKDATEALPAATAIELFHNFSLIHDDIMDKAPLRRGQQTIHEKYNLNTAILSGDATLVLAYQELMRYEAAPAKHLIKLFNDTALGVCEGQQYDMDFETLSTVKVEDYLEMIRLKTAILLGCAMQMGAILANAAPDDQAHAYQFGLKTGMAFQLQDDWLDTFASSAQSGKQQGGDIIANKKTWLLLKTMELANPEDRTIIADWLTKTDYNAAEKVEAITALYQKYKVDAAAQHLIQTYTDEAFAHLTAIEVPVEFKHQLQALAMQLLVRKV